MLFTCDVVEISFMTPKEAFEKCLKENRRILELEEMISTNMDCSYLYARDVIRGPFQLGEDVISTDSYYSYFYVLHVIKKPWKKGEEIISKDSEFSYEYARNIIKGLFKKGEDAIIRKPSLSYKYAINIIQGPFEKCHPVILNSSFKYNYMEFLKSINYDMSEISEWLL